MTSAEAAGRHSRAGAGRRLDLVALARAKGRLGVLGRLGWGVADQAVSSLSNFALGLLVARSLGAVPFGAFTLAFLTYSLVLNASRGMATDPLMVRFSGVAHPQWHRATADAAGTALSVGVVAGAVCLPVGLLLPAPVGPAFVALSVGLPGLMVQDSWRFAFFAAGRPRSALVNDLVWLVLLVAGLMVLNRAGGTTVFSCLIMFAGTATAAAVVGGFQARTIPRPQRVRSWLHTHRQLWGRYLIENLSAGGASQLRSVILGGVAGLAAVGYVRGAELLMGPFFVILFGVSQVVVPEAGRLLRRSPGRLPRFCLALGGAQALAVLAWGAAMAVALPLGLGQLLLKQLWQPVSHLLLPMTLNVASACFLAAFLAGVRAMGAARRSLRAQLLTSAANVVGGVIGAVLGAAAGATWGVMAANTFGALIWWYHLRAGLAEHRGSLEVTA